MLNEVLEASRDLAHHGLLQSTTHPDIKNVGKAECLVIEIDQNGKAHGFRFLTKKETAALWKHSKGNHNSFPAIRVQHPLLASTESKKIDDAEWKKANISDKREALLRLNFSAVNEKCEEIVISDWSLKKLEAVSNTEESSLEALKQLIHVFPRQGGQGDFIRGILEHTCQMLLGCNDDGILNYIKALLVGNEKNGQYIANCMTYYDVYEVSRFDNLVSAKETQSSLIALLNESEDSDDAGDEALLVSALTGRKTKGIESKYPNPNLPILGLTYLYSKKADIPCLARYGLTSVDAFPAGQDEVVKLNDALAFLTSADREGKTWRLMGSCISDKPQLLIAYLEDDPKNDALLASVLSALSEYETNDEYREEKTSYYEVLCGQVIGGIEQVLKGNPNTQVELLILESLDAGRKQISYEERLSAKLFVDNLKLWDAAFKNWPPVELRLWQKKKAGEQKGTATVYGKICPGPDEMCRLFKYNYTRNGVSEMLKHSAVSISEIYGLYMPRNRGTENWNQLLDRIMEITVQKSGQFLSDIGCVLNATYALPSGNRSKTRARQASLFISMLSILLYLKDIRKENYMKSVAYNVGQFLQLADILHKEYHIHERNGGNRKNPLPSTLMGNDVFLVAAENPIEGMNRLEERMKIYIGWARLMPTEKSGCAKWALKRLEEVSASIAEGNLPERFTPEEKAQVLLGYLAKIEGKDEKDAE